MFLAQQDTGTLEKDDGGVDPRPGRTASVRCPLVKEDMEHPDGVVLCNHSLYG